MIIVAVVLLIVGLSFLGSFMVKDLWKVLVKIWNID